MAMRWIGLHLPWLSLEAYVATLPPELRSEPLALLEAQLIAGANAAARRLGVRAGQKRATALALAPQLRLAQADAERDAQALQAVAHAALAFTPAVTLTPQQQVLMEVQASLRYFDGLDALLQRLRAALEPLGHRVRCASAPTAQGAALLARHRDGLHCADLPALSEVLGRIPVWLLGPGREHWEALQGMGLREVSDLRSLPRAGLARRFGEALLDELDRAYGDRPDPRPWLQPPSVFESRLELWARADSTEQVLHGAGLLLARLVAWAAAQQAQVSRCSLVMQHEGRPPTTLDVALASPSRDAAHLQLLLRERLARVQLPAPTLELHLHCAHIVHSAAPNSELFPTPRSEQEGLVRLIERLRARLGPEGVQRLMRVEDYRPERATVSEPVLTLPRQTSSPSRGSLREVDPADAVVQQPVWLLPAPQRLPEREGLPWFGGSPLSVLCGPERIESGWWDGGLVERDYYIAEMAEGALVWIYRSRVPRPAAGEAQPGWYLQGRFG